MEAIKERKIKDNLKRIILLLILLLGMGMTAQEPEDFNIFVQDSEGPWYQDFSFMSATPPDMTEHLTWKHNYKEVYYRYLQRIFIVSKDGNKYGLVDEKKHIDYSVTI